MLGLDMAEPSLITGQPPEFGSSQSFRRVSICPGTIDWAGRLRQPCHVSRRLQYLA